MLKQMAIVALALTPSIANAANDAVYPWIGTWCEVDQPTILTISEVRLAVTSEEAGCDLGEAEALAVGNAWQIEATCYFDSGPGRADTFLFVVDQSPAETRPVRLFVNWTGSFYHRVATLEPCDP